MVATSASGIGPGSADKETPPSIDINRLNGAKIIHAGLANMTGGEVTITHSNLESWGQDTTLRFAVSCSAYPVFVFAFNSSSFIVKSLETGSSFTFYWFIISLV
jgi:hypothetical protein